MSLLGFTQWLENTAGSTALRESLFMYPLVESTHVVTLTLFLGLTFMMDLRLLGVTLGGIPASSVVRRLRPWMLAGFTIMMVTGILLFYAIPVRTYHSVWFRGKMLMLVLAGLNVWMFHTRIWQRVADWDLFHMPPRAARLAGIFSIVLWSGIVISGRLIAYNWFDCDLQPQSALVNFIAGCVVDAD